MDRYSRRVWAIATFASDRWLRDPCEDHSRTEPLPSDLLPPRRDGPLVADAWAVGAHAFITRDRGVLSRDTRLRSHGLRLWSPEALLTALRDANELSELEPDELPATPDLQMLAELYALGLGEAD